MEEIRNNENEIVNNEEFFDDFDDAFEDAKPLEEKKSLIDSAKDFGGKVVNWGKNTLTYIKENPVEALEKAGAVGAGVAGLVLLGKTVGDIDKLSKTVYSDEIGEGVILKKKLNNADKTELDYRMKNGQTKIEALQSMNLIK